MLKSKDIEIIYSKIPNSSLYLCTYINHKKKEQFYGVGESKEEARKRLATKCSNPKI